MSLDKIKTVFDIAGSIAEILGILIAGYWAFRLYIRNMEGVPITELFLDIKFHRKINNYWIVELIVKLENKGKVPHKLEGIKFKLLSINDKDSAVESKMKDGNEISFHNTLHEGDFKPKEWEYCFLGPGEKDEYNYTTRVAVSTELVLFEAWYEYENDNSLLNKLFNPKMYEYISHLDKKSIDLIKSVPK